MMPGIDNLWARKTNLSRFPVVDEGLSRRQEVYAQPAARGVNVNDHPSPQQVVDKDLLLLVPSDDDLCAERHWRVAQRQFREPVLLGRGRGFAGGLAEHKKPNRLTGGLVAQFGGAKGGVIQIRLTVLDRADQRIARDLHFAGVFPALI